MRCEYACSGAERMLSRRSFIARSMAAAGGLGYTAMVQPAGAQALASSGKRVLVVYLAGGVSQLETWDPKPNTDTGGPFRAIPTSVPGIHVSELLPYTAKQMHHLSIVRSVNTKENDHGKGHYIMHTGRAQDPAQEYPHLGSVAAKLLGKEDNPLPGYIHISPGGSGIGKQDAAFLGPKYASLSLGNGQPPANLDRPETLKEQADLQRNLLREQLNRRFQSRRRSAQTDAYNYSFEQAAKLMARKDVFDLQKESPKDLERYGTHDFGRHCLLARRLLENGVTFVKVTHTNYDTHFENFDFHLEQLGEFDRTFATLIEDLAQRGLLDSTLVLVNSEFGRTPSINRFLGRDHWGMAWSVVVSGCGVQRGAVIGKTNENGTAVADREVNGAHLFHTYFRALGIDSKENHDAAGRPVPLADPQAEPIQELLA
ncbi:MAG: DUF1501 domain-containing protein [Planctomycetota bacterium]